LPESLTKRFIFFVAVCHPQIFYNAYNGNVNDLSLVDFSQKPIAMQ
jgi:hypothetical protein